MTNYEEMAARVLKRRDEYLKEKRDEKETVKKRIRIIAGPVLATAAMVAVALTVTFNHNTSGVIDPDISSPNGVEPNAPVTDDVGSSVPPRSDDPAPGPITKDPDLEKYYRPCFEYVETDKKKVEGTFADIRSSEVEEIIEKYSGLVRDYDCRYRNIVWYVVRDLGLTRKDVEAYNERLDKRFKFSSEDIDALFIKDESTARAAMAETYTLFDGDKVYIPSEIVLMDIVEFDSHNFKTEDIARVVNYFESFYVGAFDYRVYEDPDRARVRHQEEANAYINLFEELSGKGPDELF